MRRAPSDNRVLAVEQEISSLADQISNAAVVGRASVAEAERIRPFAGAAARQAYFEQSMSLAQEQLKNPAATVEATQADVVRRPIHEPATSSPRPGRW